MRHHAHLYARPVESYYTSRGRQHQRGNPRPQSRQMMHHMFPREQLTQVYQGPQPTPLCPREDCRMPVRQLVCHMARMHTEKTWGFQCECGFSTSSVDAHLFASHRIKMHAAAKWENINPHKVSIPGAYFAMVKCGQCGFQGFNSAHVSSHEASSHTVVHLPTFRFGGLRCPSSLRPYPLPCSAANHCTLCALFPPRTITYRYLNGILC